MSSFHYEPLAGEAEFEELILDLYNSLHEAGNFVLYKHRGSTQYGIDIFSSKLGMVIQCKKKDTARSDKQLRSELVQELRECVSRASLSLPFDFNTFILATTAKKFSEVQDLAASLSAEHKCGVIFLSWPDIEKHIHRFPKVRSKHYPHLEQPAAKPNIKIKDSVFTTGDVIVKTQRAPKILRLPIPNTIGANPMLKSTVTERFNKLGDERAKRHGQTAFSVMYNNFKRDFGISKNHKWTTIWEWPDVTAKTIIDYLDEKWSNTIAGRIEKSRSNPDYVPSRPQLFAREKHALSMFGLDVESVEVKNLLSHHFGVKSHTKLTQSEHWLFVIYLEAAAERGAID